MYHVKEIPTAPPGGLDMNIADEEEFSPDKLRANLERVYMTIVCVGEDDSQPPTHTTTGHWNDLIRQTHRPPPLMARIQPHVLLRCNIFLGLAA